LDEMIAFRAEDEAALREEEFPVKTTVTPTKTKVIAKPKSSSNKEASFIMGEQLGIKRNTKSPTPPISKKTSSKPAQQIESNIAKEATPNKVKSIVKKALKNKSNSSNDDSFFQI